MIRDTFTQMLTIPLTCVLVLAWSHLFAVPLTTTQALSAVVAVVLIGDLMWAVNAHPDERPSGVAWWALVAAAVWLGLEIILAG